MRMIQGHCRESRDPFLNSVTSLLMSPFIDRKGKTIFMLFNLKCLSPIITGVVIVILSSCSKDETPRNNQPIPILTDAQKFKLKEVSV